MAVMALAEAAVASACRLSSLIDSAAATVVVCSLYSDNSNNNNSVENDEKEKRQKILLVAAIWLSVLFMRGIKKFNKVSKKVSWPVNEGKVPYLTVNGVAVLSKAA